MSRKAAVQHVLLALESWLLLVTDLAVCKWTHEVMHTLTVAAAAAFAVNAGSNDKANDQARHKQTARHSSTATCAAPPAPVDSARLVSGSRRSDKEQRTKTPPTGSNDKVTQLKHQCLSTRVHVPHG